MDLGLPVVALRSSVFLRAPLEATTGNKPRPFRASENQFRIVETERLCCWPVAKYNVAKHKTWDRAGKAPLGEAAMPGQTPASLKFPLTLAAPLRRAFDGIVSSPLPQKLAELARRLKSSERTEQTRATDDPRGRR
jgi:hypothetical protein